MLPPDIKALHREQDEAEAERIENDPHLRYATCRLLQSQGDVYRGWHKFLQTFGIHNPTAASEVWDEIYNEKRLTS